MNRPLFVHSDPGILDRLNRESGGSALVTNSMVQALQWITNSDTPLAGVFVSPDDSSFSTFRFLEITLIHRPVLPIFLFEPSASAHFESLQVIMKNVHVRGVYSGTESFHALVATLKENMDNSDTIRKKVPAALQKSGYLAVPISDFFTGSQFPYDIFILDSTDKMNLFAQKEGAIDPAYLSRAAAISDFLYVREKDIAETKAVIVKTRSNFLDQDISFNWKTAEVMSSAQEILNEMKSSGMSDQLIEYTQTMLGDLFKLISKIDSDEGSISGMIEKAKKCDRSVFCATYSILVCKQLGFEKTATLEILGLASVLQDISLYGTPFGDLSEKQIGGLNADALAYYLKHPTLSADLVSHHTDVPQVTLQVMRQQHERRDKTGYPNRVGGTQLHPMGEILSIINSFYDATRSLTEDSLMIQELQKSVFPHYSDNVVRAFKVVLGNILKEKINLAHQNKSTEKK